MVLSSNAFKGPAMNENLITYTNHDGVKQTIKGLSLSQDKVGRYWLWHDSLEQNLAYKTKTREDTLLAALDSALFLLSLKQERIDELSIMCDRVQTFIEAIKGDQDESI